MVSTRDTRRICLRRNYVEFFCARSHTNTVKLSHPENGPFSGVKPLYSNTPATTQVLILAHKFWLAPVIFLLFIGSQDQRQRGVDGGQT